EPQGILTVTAREGSLAVAARVEGIRGAAYRWDWGDGAKEETSQPTAAHTYASLGVYVITVDVLDLGQGGDGGPGPGNQVVPVVKATLSAVVDLRPTIELIGIHVMVIDPPNWYDPQKWPENCFPASCSLKLSSVLRINRPGAPQPTRAVWTIFQGDTFHFQGEGDPFIFPYDKFIGPGCGGGRKEYRIQLVLFLSDGSILQTVKVIYACPPNGCG
ncbi:MAG: PKD domain-containing protein, partial [Candidatus Bipolaricaulota bacterium]|nr:PKD domain-containing protein [Candidatus Bipolaricaulota bacterium]MDW8127492.1 PKD domain-containing protein [Candidatus Bipolaricaulota bacterium]